eukprot:5668883-Pleurochrysis_carterae.AAC.3
MPDPNNTGSVSKQPSWVSSKLSQRAWLDDLLPWLPTNTASYASLIKHGFIHAHAARTRGGLLLPTCTSRLF